jgi:hypothetical protein
VTVPSKFIAGDKGFNDGPETSDSKTLNWMNRGPFGGCESTMGNLRFVVTEGGRDMWVLDVYGAGGLILSKVFTTPYRCRLEASRMVGA